LNPFSLIEQTWWLGIPVAFLMGVLLGANPLALPITGTAIGLGASGALAAQGAAVKLTAAFGGGMVLVYTLVGVLAGRLDELVEGILRPYSGIGYLLLGLLILGFALWLMFRPSAFCASCESAPRQSSTIIGAFVAGIPGGFVNCPACAAIITGVAASSATLGNPLYSGVVIFALGAGHAGLLVGLMWFVTKGWTPPNRLMRGTRIALGVILIALAGYFFYLASVEGLSPGGGRLV
jgi:cytochrome c biogenesis protein CcdA